MVKCDTCGKEISILREPIKRNGKPLCWTCAGGKKIQSKTIIKIIFLVLVVGLFIFDNYLYGYIKEQNAAPGDLELEQLSGFSIFDLLMIVIPIVLLIFIFRDLKEIEPKDQIKTKTKKSQ